MLRCGLVGGTALRFPLQRVVFLLAPAKADEVDAAILAAVGIGPQAKRQAREKRDAIVVPGPAAQIHPPAAGAAGESHSGDTPRSFNEAAVAGAAAQWAYSENTPEALRLAAHARITQIPASALRTGD